MAQPQTVDSTNTTQFVHPHGERELLCLSARKTREPEAERRMHSLLQSRPDWNFLISLANGHGVLPLLNRTLRTLESPGVRPATLTRIGRLASENARKNLQMTAALFQVLEVFDRHAIPSIPYKGPILAASVYGDVSLRQFFDLDLIVPIDDVTRAARLLADAGYRETTRTEKDIGFVHPVGGWRLELHWEVTTRADPIHIPRERLWRDLRPFEFAGKVLNTMTLEDQLLLLSVHGTKHCWQRLGWLCDVAEIAQTGQVDWARLMDDITDLGGRRIVLLSLLLSKRILAAALPPIVQDAIDTDPALRPLSDEVWRWLWREPSERTMLGAKERLFVKLRERRWDRIRVAARQTQKSLTLSRRDRESGVLPSFLSPLLYVVRPVRLAREHGVAPFRRFLKDCSLTDDP